VIDPGGLMEGPNLFYAVRVDGHFASVTTRSVPRQDRPYPPLVEVAKTQPVFRLEEVSGTLAGFRLPDLVRGLNVPGFHLHFLTADRQAGGHVLDLVLTRGELAIDTSARFHLELPTDPTFLHADLGRDRGEALDQAERGKAGQTSLPKVTGLSAPLRALAGEVPVDYDE
jgi:acetolactate decarboxylase